MRSPDFWWHPPGWASALLQPAAVLYGVIAARRMDAPGAKAAIPVICVGNVTVGGAGKTPTALAVASMLRELGRRPAFLTRGYGGRLRGPVAVDPSHHGPDEVGDEALLLARAAPTIVSRDRPAGAAAAAAGGADVVVMDDGLQNPALRKDMRLAVFDGAVGAGNGATLPAGPLRAPLRAQWPHIDAVVVIGPGRAGDAIARRAAELGKAVLRARLVADDDAAARLAGRRVLAFAGIGRPAKFFASLAECGAEVVATRAFADHHVYAPGEILALLNEAGAAGLTLVTTEKDKARLAALAAADPRIAAIETLAVSVRFDAPGEVRSLLRDRLGLPSAG